MNDFEAEDDHDPDGPPAIRGIDVEIGDAQNHVAIDHDRLRALAESVLRGEGVSSASISLVLVDDPTIHRINREHLNHDEPTDVISFVLSEADEPSLSGELVVSTETAARVAAEIGAPPWNEVALYVVHGLLHLCGYDDLDENASALMRQREDEALARADLMNPFRLADPRRPESQSGSL